MNLTVTVAPIDSAYFNEEDLRRQLEQQTHDQAVIAAVMERTKQRIVQLARDCGIPEHMLFGRANMTQEEE